MANFSIICALLVACCVFIFVDRTMSAPTPLKIKFLHDHTGRLVRGQPSQGLVTADGVSKGQFHYSYTGCNVCFPVTIIRCTWVFNYILVISPCRHRHLVLSSTDWQWECVCLWKCRPSWKLFDYEHSGLLLCGGSYWEHPWIYSEWSNCWAHHSVCRCGW